MTLIKPLIHARDRLLERPAIATVGAVCGTAPPVTPVVVEDFGSAVDRIGMLGVAAGATSLVDQEACWQFPGLDVQLHAGSAVVAVGGAAARAAAAVDTA